MTLANDATTRSAQGEVDPASLLRLRIADLPRLLFCQDQIQPRGLHYEHKLRRTPQSAPLASQLFLPSSRGVASVVKEASLGAAVADVARDSLGAAVACVARCSIAVASLVTLVRAAGAHTGSHWFALQCRARSSMQSSRRRARAAELAHTGQTLTDQMQHVPRRIQPPLRLGRSGTRCGVTSVGDRRRSAIRTHRSPPAC